MGLAVHATDSLVNEGIVLKLDSAMQERLQALKFLLQ